MRSSRLVRTRVAGGLAVLGSTLIAVGLTTPLTRPATPVAAAEAPSASAPAVVAATTPPAPTPATPPTRRHAVPTAEVRDLVTGPVLPESDPVLVSIPRIGVRSKLVALGLQADGAMEVPRDPARAGWFARGAAPGALGPAVIAGHVTWNGTPGVFHRLSTLRRGDRVAVSRADGTSAVFVVEKVAQYEKSRFPVRAVYGAIDHAGLRLITCGGPYDSSRYRYPDNVVVFARLVTVRT